MHHFKYKVPKFSREEGVGGGDTPEPPLRATPDVPPPARTTYGDSRLRPSGGRCEPIVGTLTHGWAPFGACSAPFSKS